MADEKTNSKATLAEDADMIEDVAEAADLVDDADIDLGDTGDLGLSATPSVTDEAEVEAEAEDEDEMPAAPRAVYEDSPQGFGLPVLIAAACAALMLGVLVGRFLLGGGSSPSPAVASQELAGKVAVSEGELDSVIATYEYAGETYDVTVRDAIVESSSLDASRDAEGNYRIPSIDAVLTVVRNRILMQEAENRGVVVSDEELATYSETTLGTSDYAYIAASYGMDEEGVKTLLRESAMMSRLRDDVVGASPVATMPEAPATPEATEGWVYNEETGEDEWVESDGYGVATPEYASYIISLAGDEWDAAAGTWASNEGPYASTLSGYEITADGATYEAAQAAYYVAYQLYTESMSTASSAWSSFVNSLLSNATISFSTMVA